jgi:hypothetical protein
MIPSTTPTIQGTRIQHYHGLVTVPCASPMPAHRNPHTGGYKP